MGLNNWRNEILCAALNIPFKISHHSDSCGDSDNYGCQCEPDPGTGFEFYCPAGIHKLLVWIYNQPWKRDFISFVRKQTKLNFTGEALPLILLIDSYHFPNLVLDYVRKNGLQYNREKEKTT